MRYVLLVSAWLSLLSVSTHAAPPVDRQKETEAALAKKSAELRIEDKTLSEAMAVVAKAANVEITIDWKMLEPAGVKKETPITGRFRNTSYKKVLSHLLDQVANQVDESNPPKLTHYVDEEGKVVITTGDASDGRGL